MRTISLLILLFALLGCEAPRRTRMIPGNSTGDALGPPINFNPGLPGGEAGNLTPSPIGGGTSGSGAGFEFCDLSLKYSTVDIGRFGICQSSQDESVIKFIPEMASPSVRVCLIPTYKDPSGSSTYLGNPQCTYTSANVMVQGKLYKDRPGFNTYPINGVIVMKEPLLQEYIGCMHGYINWPVNACKMDAQYCSYWQPRCPYGTKSNQACDAEGRNFMAKICTAFKSKYSNAYVDIKLK